MRLLSLLFLLLSFCVYGQQASIDQARKLYESKKYTEAKGILKQLDDDSKEYAAAQYYLGRIAFDEKEYDDAEDFFEEAVDANNRVADYFDWLGNTYGVIAQDANTIRQGMLAPKMKSAWEKAIALDPKMLSARKSLIQYYLRAPSIMGGSPEKAKEVAQQIIRINVAEGHRSLGDVYNHQKQTTEAEKE
jgi:tetratricopeptide (TPR) repeat protein